MEQYEEVKKFRKEVAYRGIIPIGDKLLLRAEKKQSKLVIVKNKDEKISDKTEYQDLVVVGYGNQTHTIPLGSVVHFEGAIMNITKTIPEADEEKEGYFILSQYSVFSYTIPETKTETSA